MKLSVLFPETRSVDNVVALAQRSEQLGFHGMFLGTAFGIDPIMALPTAFGLGFERTIPEWKFGPNPNTFGHNGSGGSLGIVDPDTGISLGYVMNRMVWGPTRDDPRWPAIFDALYGCL